MGRQPRRCLTDEGRVAVVSTQEEVDWSEGQTEAGGGGRAVQGEERESTGGLGSGQEPDSPVHGPQ